MDRFVASLFEKIFPSPPGAQHRQFFAGSETPEVRGLRAERMINRDETPPEGDPDVPEEPPLDTREFIKPEVMPEFPFKAPSVGSNVAPPIQPNPLPATPPMTAQSAQTAKSSADRIYRRNLMALAGTISNQMAQNDVISHELATQVGCPPETIDALLTGKSGGLTLDGLEGIAEKLGLVLVLQLRTFSPPAGSQPAGRAGGPS
jgi:DNA-binding Xre family transcriptional regulator